MGIEYPKSCKSSGNDICIFAVNIDIFTKYTRDIMKKNGKKTVKNVFVKLLDI